MAERVPTQFIETFKSSDFGPEQEEAGARIDKLARPPPTELIETHSETVRPGDEVVAELDQTQRSMPERGRRAAKVARAIWDATVDGAVRFANEAQRALGRDEKAGEMLTVADDCSLVRLPKMEAEEVVQLLRGARVVAFSEIEAPPGWIATRAPNGELGYVPAHHLIRE